MLPTKKPIEFKMAQLCDYRNIDQRNNINVYKSIINHILEEDFNINYVFTVDGLTSGKTTALHWAYERLCNIELFEILLNRKADFTVKNGRGETVLHLIIRKYLGYEELTCSSKDLPFINIVLSAHVKYKKFVNPRFESGLSHFHAACIVNHVEAIELFLKNGSLVDEAIDVKSLHCAGFTPLHFAARFFSFEAAQLLLNYGANLHIRCAKGFTPTHLLVQQRIQLFNILQGFIKTRYCQEKIMKNIDTNEKILKLILGRNLLFDVGLSEFHIACMLKDSSIAKSLFEYIIDINCPVSVQSPIFQKCTAAHFAAICNIDTVKFLASRGASMEIEDKNKNTPFYLCIQRYDVKDIHWVLLQYPIWKNIVFSNGKTLLLDVLFSIRSIREFTIFLEKNMEDINMFIPTDSPLWPGFTLLHIAVIFSKVYKGRCIIGNSTDSDMVRSVLQCKINIDAQDGRGQTCIHIAFRQKKRSITKILLKHLILCDENINQVDEENLSYLHIACAMENEELILKLLRTSDLNSAYKGESSICSIHPGWTPLHIAVSVKSIQIVKMLVKQGANINATDLEGLTPIHWLLRCESPNYREQIGEILLAPSTLQNCTVPQFGLHYLHIASFANNVKAVEKLIKLKVPLFTTISYAHHSRFHNHDLKRPSSFLLRYINSTPLSLAMSCENSTKIINLLLYYSGDAWSQLIEDKIFSKEENTRNNFILMLKDNNCIHKHVEEILGLTMLHIACYVADVELTEKLLNKGADVNRQINSNSPIFPGFTPLHICLNRYINLSSIGKKNIDLLVELLLNHEADVTLLNTYGDTPIFTLYNQNTHHLGDSETKIIAKVFRHQRDFSINPFSAGISHFHVACLINDLETIKKFLRYCQIDINRPVTSFYTSPFAGYTPLHLALECQSKLFPTQLEIIDLLLSQDSKVHAEDINGNTPLHKAVCIRRSRVNFIEKLLAYGACMNTENIEGVTPFEMLLSNNISVQEIQLLLDHGCSTNTFNRFSGEGYIGKFLVSMGDFEIGSKSILKELIKFLDECGLNDVKRTAIHNSVAVSALLDSQLDTEDYHQLFTDLSNLNCHIDHQDMTGKAALHYAAQFENEKGVAALLLMGADVNVTDKSGKLGLSYSVENCTAKSHHVNRSNCNSCKITDILMNHVKKLQFLGLEVNELHSVLESNNCERLNIRSNMYTINTNFYTEVEKTKEIDFGFSSLNLYGFLFETGAVTRYPYLNGSNRDVIKSYFNSISMMHFREIESILKLQFNKAEFRLRLIDEAVNSLSRFLGFSFLGLCEEVISYLPNYDLESLIGSAIENRK